MTRQLPVSELVYDQFPVFDVDGYTKYPGLVQNDFDVTIFKNGLVQTGYSFLIVEVGSTGEYEFRFTPDTEGFWLAEVQIPLNFEIWRGQYDIVEGFEYRAVGLF